MTTVLLLRHASAGSRREWEGDDCGRPLDRKGRRQATALAVALAERGIDRILSSPYLRCLQTVEPIAERLGVDVELEQALAEGSSAPATRRALASTTAAVTLACTHGDVVAELVGWGQEARKASIWLLQGPGLEPARYLPPPQI